MKPVNVHIAKMRLVNFRGHLDTTIEFCPGINCLHGSSRTGKSTVLLGLRWVATNSPSSDFHVPDWLGVTEVIVWLSNGDSVARIKGKSTVKGQRGKSVNQYVLNGDYENPLGTPGTGTPPKQVTDILRLNDINFQQQVALPFLFGLKPKPLGEMLNRLINLESIDTVIGFLGKQAASKKAVIEVLQKQEAVKIAELAKYAGLDDLGALLDRAELLEDKAGMLEIKLERLDSTVTDIASVLVELSRLPDVETALADIAIAFDAKQEAETAGRRYNSIAQLESSIVQATRTVTSFATVEEELQSLELVETLVQTAVKAEDKVGRLSELQDSIVELQQDCSVTIALPELEDAGNKAEAALLEFEQLEKRDYNLAAWIVRFDIFKGAVTKIGIEQAEMEERLVALMPEVCPLRETMPGICTHT